ncbi:MAG: universal stress protein [Candidatus Omnitrophota bacterium]|jgi:nucleotide-binding universal stress UspA family protein
MASIKSIAVSVSSGTRALVTAKYAIYLAKLLNSKLYALYVIDEKSLQDLLRTKIFVEVEAVEYERDLKDQGESLLLRVKKMAQEKNVECEGLLLKGVIHDEVIKKVKEINADLLVMGEPKEVLSRREIFYDEAERIFRESSCPVVIVKDNANVEKIYNELE